VASCHRNGKQKHGDPEAFDPNEGLASRYNTGTVGNDVFWGIVLERRGGGHCEFPTPSVKFSDNGARQEGPDSTRKDVRSYHWSASLISSRSTTQQDADARTSIELCSNKRVESPIFRLKGVSED